MLDIKATSDPGKGLDRWQLLHDSTARRILASPPYSTGRASRQTSVPGEVGNAENWKQDRYLLLCA